MLVKCRPAAGGSRIDSAVGGGVLANELAQKGVSVVALEAGGRHLPEDYVIPTSQITDSYTHQLAQRIQGDTKTL